MRLELPSVQIQSVALDPVDGLALINLVPADGATGVSIGASVVLEITSTTATAPDASDTSVLVNGTLAYLNGVFQPGFTGSTSTPGFQTLQITIDPDADFTTLEVVDIRVQSEDIGNTAQLNQIYSFQIEDLVPPELLAANAVSLTEVEATFNESISDSALAESAWSVSPIDVPSAMPPAIAVSRIAGERFLITFAEELSFLRRYELVVENVEDEFGNVLIEGRAPFLSLDCERPAGRQFSLIEWVPRRVRAADISGDQAAHIAIWQDIFDIVLCEVDAFFVRAIDPDTAIEQYLDLMLRDLRNPFNFEDLGVEEKRQLVLTLNVIYAFKGTAVGMESAILFFTGIEAVVNAFNSNEGFLQLGISELGVDWVLGTGDAFLKNAFTIIVQQVLTDAERTKIRSIVLYMKPHWTHFLGIEEPSSEVIEHLSLGLSELGVNWILH